MDNRRHEKMGRTVEKTGLPLESEKSGLVLALSRDSTKMFKGKKPWTMGEIRGTYGSVNLKVTEKEMLTE